MHKRECNVLMFGSPHKQEFVDNIAASVENGQFGKNVHNIATAANTTFSQNGEFIEGALVEVDPTMPLSEARRVTGNVLGGRIGVYNLKQEPTHINTSKKLAQFMQANKVADSVDVYGESYGPCSIKNAIGTPWVPQLNNGHARDNMVKIARSVNGSQYTMLVKSNTTPQYNESIDAAIQANPDVTVEEFVRSPAYARLSEIADLQNNRIADRIAEQLKIAHLIDTRFHTTEKTSSDAYAAPVRYANADAMVKFSDMALANDGKVRLANQTIDLKTVKGSLIPLIQGPMHGFTLLANQTGASCARAQNSKTNESIAVGPRRIQATPMGEDEHEIMSSVLHWPNKNELTATQVASNISSYDTLTDTFDATAIKTAGLEHLQPTRFKTLGAVVFP